MIRHLTAQPTAMVLAATLNIVLACTPSATSPPILTRNTLANTTYRIDHPAPRDTAVADTISLVDGLYDGLPAEHLRISLLDSMSFGDLDGDSVADAAVLLARNYGGSGVFVELAAVLNRGGVPVHVASVLLGDRVRPVQIDIANGIVTVHMIAHGPNEPMCCPTIPAIRRYALWNGRFTVASTTPTAK